METSFHHIDPSHDLGLEFHMQRFKPLDLKFPRMEKFCAMAKFNGTKFSLSEYVTFYPDLSNGTEYLPIYLLLRLFYVINLLIILVLLYSRSNICDRGENN